MNASAIPDNDPAWTVMEDTEALKRYARLSDPRAFEVLTGRYQAMVLATCLRALGNEADAEDAAQETFLKLARQAGTIRTNVAAWLHACAMHTSVDLIRRAGSRRRAERAVMRDAEPSAGVDVYEQGQALWRDIEPVIDAALQALDEAERELIVSRFLAGRSQAELAKQAGVSEGTLSRRLQRALTLLRDQLSTRGLVVAGATLLPAALAEGSTVSASGTFSASIGKIGLSGIGGGTATSAATHGGLASKLVAVLLCVGLLIGGGFVTSRLMQPGDGPVGNVSAVGLPLSGGEAVPRPRRVQDGYQLISAAHASFDAGGVVIGPDRIRIILNFDESTGRQAEMDLLILSVDRSGDTPVLQMRVTRIRLLPGMEVSYREGQQFSAAVSFDRFGRIVIEPTTPDIQLGKNEPNWFGVRPPKGWPEHEGIPADAGELGILGPWAASERWPVVLKPDEIVFGAENWQAAIYRIIDWAEADGFTRATTIYAGGYDRRLVGTRFKMLIRQCDDGRYEIATYPPEAKMGDRWPTGFEHSPDNPVQVYRFAEAYG